MLSCLTLPVPSGWGCFLIIMAWAVYKHDNYIVKVRCIDNCKKHEAQIILCSVGGWLKFTLIKKSHIWGTERKIVFRQFNIIIYIL